LSFDTIFALAPADDTQVIAQIPDKSSPSRPIGQRMLEMQKSGFAINET
jgi:hypothetical protein